MQYFEFEASKQILVIIANLFTHCSLRTTQNDIDIIFMQNQKQNRNVYKGEFVYKKWADYFGKSDKKKCVYNVVVYIL